MAKSYNYFSDPLDLSPTNEACRAIAALEAHPDFWKNLQTDGEKGINKRKLLEIVSEPLKIRDNKYLTDPQSVYVVASYILEEGYNVTKKDYGDIVGEFYVAHLENFSTKEQKAKIFQALILSSKELWKNGYCDSAMSYIEGVALRTVKSSGDREYKFQEEHAAATDLWADYIFGVARTDVKKAIKMADGLANQQVSVLVLPLGPTLQAKHDFVMAELGARAREQVFGIYNPPCVLK